MLDVWPSVSVLVPANSTVIESFTTASCDNVISDVCLPRQIRFHVVIKNNIMKQQDLCAYDFRMSQYNGCDRGSFPDAFSLGLDVSEASMLPRPLKNRVITS